MSTTLLSDFVIKGEKMVAKEGSKIFRTFCTHRKRENMEGRGRKKKDMREKGIDRIRSLRK